MYLTYDDFLFYGGSIEDQQRYGRHEYRARMFLDLITLGRIDEIVAQRESVKRCMYELIENYEREYAQKQLGIGVSSASNDGVSVSFGGMSVAATVNKECMDIARQYLSNEFASCGLPLLYKGVC